MSSMTNIPDDNKPQAAPPASVDAEKLIATGERLLRVQQARMTAARAEHERLRTERVSWYRGEMQKIADDAEHELLMLDRAWEKTRQDIEMIINKLKALRGAIE